MYAKLITVKTGNVTEYVIFGDSATLSELAHALLSASRGEGVAPVVALDANTGDSLLWRVEAMPSEAAPPNNT
jgi:hypothetical protein